jgi:hypothetical protein
LFFDRWVCGDATRPFTGNVPIDVEVGGQALPTLSR